jgi:protein-tyrosine phosphatase
MIDLHCHILPGIDDGAKDVAEARAMLDQQRAAGVTRMVLTPHFHPEAESPDAFLSTRDKAWNILSTVLTAQEKELIRLGAEVRYCPGLLSMDLRRLTLGDSDYLLLEMPEQDYPAYTVQVAERLMGNGLIPVLAHVERCAYFRREPELLKRLVDLGVLTQVSLRALFDKRDQNFSAACLGSGLAQLVASDAHNLSHRRPCMELLAKLPRESQLLHEATAEAVWENELPPYFRADNIKKTFFGYR